MRGGHEAAAAFRTLRTLVNNWLVDATERRNPYADALLGQLRRWLLSAFSSLREPALRHLVELCMKKAGIARSPPLQFCVLIEVETCAFSGSSVHHYARCSPW